jgi:hypothetical protein
MEKVNSADLVTNEEVLHRINEERNILQTIKRKRLTALVTSRIGTSF